MSLANRDQMLARLVYAIARTDGEVQPDERHTLADRLAELFEDLEANMILDYFDDFGDRQLLIKDVIDEFRLNNIDFYFTADDAPKVQRVMLEVAGAHSGVDEEEQALLDRINQALEALKKKA